MSTGHIAESLNPKMIEVLQLAADGLTYAAIAQQLDRPQRTIVSQAIRAMHILGADNITQAAAMAIRRGLIK